MNRLFIGLTISPIVTEKLNPVLEKLATFKDEIKTVSPTHMHITMKFLGNVDDETTSKIIKILPEALKTYPPVNYDAVGLGAFPSLQKASVLWCGIKTDSRPLVDLHDATEKAMERLGFKRETRTFRPHITLGRIRKGRKLPPPILRSFRKNSNFHFGASLFNEIVLFKSDLTPEGPHYTELLTIRLKEKR